jgi:hypothetical protein
MTRRTPRVIAASSFLADANPRSPAARSGGRLKMAMWRSSAGVATRVWGEEPWMVWKGPGPKDVETEIEERSADLEERLDRELKQLGANWLTEPLSDEWLLEQVSLLGLPRRQLERLI